MTPMIFPKGHRVIVKRSVAGFALLVFGWSASAQDLQSHVAGPGQLSRSAVGVVGQRQTASETATAAVPNGRIDERINNRVQSRIRNRVDGNYDPQANATSPFKIAEEQARAESVRR